MEQNLRHSFCLYVPEDIVAHVLAETRLHRLRSLGRAFAL